MTPFPVRLGIIPIIPFPVLPFPVILYIRILDQCPGLIKRITDNEMSAIATRSSPPPPLPSKKRRSRKRRVNRHAAEREVRNS